MADALIAATVTVLLEKAIAMAADRIGLMRGFYDGLKAMEGHARDIRALLADAETKQSQNPTVLRWLKNVEGAAFKAENVLDELLYERLRRQVHEFKRGAAAKVCLFFSMSKHDISFRVRMSSKVRGINEKLKDIKLKALDIELVRLLGRDTGVTVEATNRLTHSLPEQFVTGRSKEESEIVDMLLLGSSDENSSHVSVLPIVGMGGLGKTTLAKSIYNNVKIVNHFSKRSWICVSDAKFDVTGILKGILESLKGGEKLEMSSPDAIVHGIQKELSGERFLFVLDDVWNEDSGLWDRFFTSLVGLNSAGGSCCVLTTRLQTTANLVSTSSFDPFVLNKLSNDDCWSIIGRKATKGGEMPPEFMVHREGVLRKCQGLPLAANAIGGLLSLQRKEDWLSIVENKILKVSESVEDRIMPILKLSYDYLPSPHIKKCFAYCSVYSKDADMSGQELIELWMAEGYLQQDDMQRRTTMEEDGADCLTILLQSSLLEKKTDYYDSYYQMHDLVHDLAESISEREQFDEEYKYLQCRHLALGEEKLSEKWNAKAKQIQIQKAEISDEMLLKYKHVRVLRLLSTKQTNLPSAVGKLRHLRCLDLSAITTKSLPESLCKLYNLQTLRLKSFSDLEYLPQGLSNLISLRHLHFTSWEPEFKMPAMMGRLTNLQTLWFFNIGENSGCGIEELGTMRNLRGDIEIRNLELVKGKEEAGRANMVEKKNLMGLTLLWGHPIDGSNRDDEPVLDGLEPCPTLQELSIVNYVGVRLPRWLGKLSALVKLDLINCRELVGFEDGCAFPKLVSLSLSNCCQLSSVPTHFPSLERLSISGGIPVSVLRHIIGKSTSLKTLGLFSVDGMSSLSEVIENPLASSLEKVGIDDCDLIDIPSSTLECFPNLKSLEVEHCKKLLSCPLNLQQTPSLSEITFDDCPLLFISNEGPRGFNHLTNLKKLYIGPFSDESIQLFDWSGLKEGCSTTLQDLRLRGSPNSFLPEQLQHFSSLVRLELRGFESLECLPDWFSNLTSLLQLELLDCPRLQHFPSTHAMERLNSLRILYIDGCPLLRESPGHEIPALPNLKVLRA